jgi:hypothetical protein
MSPSKVGGVDKDMLISQLARVPVVLALLATFTSASAEATSSCRECPPVSGVL